ncbi:hypothetical protein ACHAWO_007615 [Cyclotella atomus]|uniref:Chitin-binding type-4 domain-containing protein n=1 Tax=Cyclotella atomus TaxID=382360 RepID=A0ABD3NEF0_9STRA
MQTSRTSNYHIFDAERAGMNAKVSKKSGHYIGKLRHDKGKPVGCCSRNYYASVEGKWSGGTESDPAVETCPHCLNIGGTEARCGFVGDHNYDLPPNAVGGIIPTVTQGCYKPEADITFESVLTAHHVMRHKYRLPAGLSGDLVLIQWHYVTGNSCKDVGDDTYNWPDGFYPGNPPTCSQPLPEDGRGVPEQFWNWAELKISNNCDGPKVTSTSTTTTSSTS